MAFVWTSGVDSITPNVTKIQKTHIDELRSNTDYVKDNACSAHYDTDNASNDSGHWSKENNTHYVTNYGTNYSTPHYSTNKTSNYSVDNNAKNLKVT